MGSEDIIRRILGERSDITKLQVETLIVEKQKASGDLLSLEGAAHLVAQDLLVEVGESGRSGLQISDIIPNLGDATIRARVIGLWPRQRFKRKDGTEGSLVRLLLGDRTGTIPCLIWNPDAIEGLEIGDVENKIVEVSHGYTRLDLAENVELHVGNKGHLKLLRDVANDGIYPSIEAFLTNLNEISDQSQTINVQGTIETTPILSSFQREDTTGTVLRTVIKDSTGVMTIVAWNDKAEQLKNTRVGNMIRIINGSVRKTPEGILELHLERRSIVKLLNTRVTHASSSLTPIAQLRPETGPANILGKVVSLGSLREVRTRSGAVVPVANILVADTTGVVTVTLWRKNSILVKNLEEGEMLLIENGRPQQRLGEIVLAVGESGNVVARPKSMDIRDPWNPPITPIGELRKGLMPVLVEGIIAQPPSLKEIELKNGSRTRLASFRIRDKSGAIRVIFWRDSADEVMSLRLGDRVRVVGGRVKEGFAEKWELHSNPLTKLMLIGKEIQSEETLNQSPFLS
jgi:ssDNA-binding replication factor A large subunit